MDTQKSYKRNAGFTLVELIIVIAVIGVLAAILIPTFANVIYKANVSKDTALIRDLNTAIAVNEPETVVTTISQAMTKLEAAGYTPDVIKATSKDNEIVFDAALGQFGLASFTNTKALGINWIFSADEENAAVFNSQVWFLIDAETEYAEANKTFSYYNTNANCADMTVSSNFATGNSNMNVTVEANSTVDLYMNGGNITVNENAEVASYGTKATVTATNATVTEFGNVTGKISVQSGSLVVERGANVECIEAKLPSAPGSTSIRLISGAKVPAISAVSNGVSIVSGATINIQNDNPASGETTIFSENEQVEAVTKVNNEVVDTITDYSKYEARVGNEFYEYLALPFYNLEKGEIVLLKDLKNMSRVNASLALYRTAKPLVTLNMNGHTIKEENTKFLQNKGPVEIKNGTILITSNQYAFVTVGDLTLTNVNVQHNTASVTFYGYAGHIVINNSRIVNNYQQSDAFFLTSHTTYGVSKLTINGSKSYVHGEEASVVLYPSFYNANDKMTFTLNGGEIDGLVSGNGMKHGTVTTINGGYIHHDILGIYHPQMGDLIITGGKIEGGLTGVEMRGGRLTITGGTINGGNGEIIFVQNGSGSTTNNVAVALSQHRYSKSAVQSFGYDLSNTYCADGTNYCYPNLDATIVGGNFCGTAAFQIFSDYDTPNVTATIAGGNFVGQVNAYEKLTHFIEGGNFTYATNMKPEYYKD